MKTEKYPAELDMSFFLINVEAIRKTGINVNLYFGKNGENVCRFYDAEHMLAQGESTESMPKALSYCNQEYALLLITQSKTNDTNTIK